MKIAFLTRRGERSGSARVRVYQYLKYLQDLQVETAVLPRPSRSGPLAHGSYLAQALRLASWADVLVLQKPNQSKKLIDILVRLNRRLIVDIDDAVWCAPLTKSGSSAEKLSRKFSERFLYAVKRCNFVITGSNHLARATRNFFPKAEIISIPSSVDLKTYKIPKMNEPKQNLTIGWIGNPGNFSNLYHILPVLRTVCSEFKAKIKIISSCPPEFNGLPLEFEKWSVETEVQRLLEFDIGIMPLDNDQRSLGRCGYKAIQYMAVGVPVVSTGLGAGAEVVQDSITGFHANTPDEWLTRLRLLIEDASLRQTMGQQGRKRVESLYSVETNVHSLLDAFRRRMSL